MFQYSWSLITKAKDDIIATVNLAADSLDKTEKAIVLSQIILQRSSAGNNFAGAAILSLKSEVDSFCKLFYTLAREGLCRFPQESF